MISLIIIIAVVLLLSISGALQIYSIWFSESYNMELIVMKLAHASTTIAVLVLVFGFAYIFGYL
jgi:hypothetical protein